MTDHRPSAPSSLFPEFFTQDIGRQTDGDPLPPEVRLRLQNEIGHTLITRLTELYPQSVPKASTYGVNLSCAGQDGQQSILQISATDVWWRRENAAPTFPLPSEFPEYYRQFEEQYGAVALKRSNVASYKLFEHELRPEVMDSPSRGIEMAMAQGMVYLSNLTLLVDYRRQERASRTSWHVPVLGSNLRAMHDFFEQVPNLEVESLYTLNPYGAPTSHLQEAPPAN